MAFRRESTMPMDYEWENKQGPVDARSPFMNISNNTNTFKKRPHSVLESPSKGAFATPNRPQLREPNSQHFLFNQPNVKPLPAVPSHIQESNLWEPRTPASVIDFSSGGETPNTPLYEDSEATPDTGLRNRMSNMFTNGGNGKGKSSPKKSGRRESWLGALLGKSPGKDSRGYSSKAENRVMKRRQKKALVRQDDDEGSEDDQGKARRGRKKDSNSQDAIPPVSTGNSVGAFFSFIEKHPGLPHVLSWYLQLFLNLFLVFSAMYILYSFWAAIQAEVDIQARKSMSEIMLEIATCAREYKVNNCAAGRVPAIENACSNWEACMQRDPKKIARASVTAKTFAMIFNSFVEEFSYKSMIFTVVVIFGGFNLSNWAFGIMRPKPSSHQHDSFAYPPPPATPQRYPSGGFIDQQGFYTPYGTINTSMMANNNQNALSMEADGGERKSPVKKLTFR